MESLMTKMSKNFTKGLDAVLHRRQILFSSKIDQVAFSLILFLGLMGSVMGQTTLTVGPGGTYADIQAAYDVAVDGDIIQLLPLGGDFTSGYSNDILNFMTSTITVTKNITIDGGGNMIYNSNSTDETGLGASGAKAFIFAKPPGAGTMKLSNIGFCGFRESDGCAFNVAYHTGTDPMEIENVYVSQSPITDGGDNAVQIEGSTNWVGGSVSNNNHQGVGIVHGGSEGNYMFVNLTNLNIDCNGVTGLGQYGSGLYMTASGGRNMDVTITGGSISHNAIGENRTATAIYGTIGASDNLTINGTAFIGNVDAGLQDGIVYIDDAHSGTTPEFTMTNVIFEGNSNGPVIAAERGGTITNSIFRDNTVSGNAWGTVTTTGCVFMDNTAAIPVVKNNVTYVNDEGTNTSTSATTSFNFPGIIEGECGGVCVANTIANPGASITGCLAPEEILTSTQSGDWYAMQGSTVSALLTTGASYTIPADVTTIAPGFTAAPTYTVFWQENVTNGTNPIIGDLLVTSCGCTDCFTDDCDAVLTTNTVWGTVTDATTYDAVATFATDCNTITAPTNSETVCHEFQVATGNGAAGNEIAIATPFSFTLDAVFTTSGTCTAPAATYTITTENVAVCDNVPPTTASPDVWVINTAGTYTYCVTVADANAACTVDAICPAILPPPATCPIEAAVINPCGQDGNNEFILMTNNSGADLDINNLLIGSLQDADADGDYDTDANGLYDFNYSWQVGGGDPTFDFEGGAGNTPYSIVATADAVTADLIAQLNAYASVNCGTAITFVDAAATVVPDNELFTVFLGAYDATPGYHDIYNYFDFSVLGGGIYCGQTIYVYFGTGSESTAGYFHNGDPRAIYISLTGDGEDTVTPYDGTNTEQYITCDGNNNAIASCPEPDVLSTKISAVTNDVNSDGLNDGDEITYTVTITNNAEGTEDGIAGDVNFTDIFDTNTSIVAADAIIVADVDYNATVAGAAPVGFPIIVSDGTSGTIDIDLGDMQPNDVITLTFTVTLDDPLTAGVTQIVNQGTISSNAGTDHNTFTNIGSNFGDVSTDDTTDPNIPN